MKPMKLCRPGLAHAKPCGITPDDMYCACGCAGDDTYCMSPPPGDLEDFQKFQLNSVVVEGSVPDRTLEDCAKELQQDCLVMSRSLRNVMHLALKIKQAGKRPVMTGPEITVWADHLIRFCAEAGVVPAILRDK